MTGEADEDLAPHFDVDTIARIRRADLGNRVEEELVNSAVARVIVKAAREAAEAAFDKLVACDAADTKTVQRLQNEVRRHREITDWLVAAVSNGIAAAHEIQGDEPT